MTIDEIYRKEELSIRSYHVCRGNNLNSVKELKEYLYKNKSFKKLRNCGRKSDEELISICRSYYEKGIDSIDKGNGEIIAGNPLKKTIFELNRTQREVINNFIIVNTNNLSVRSNNAISLHLKGNLKIKNFAEKILLPDNFTVKNIKNIGAKSISELDTYIICIKDFLIKVSLSKNGKHLISLKNNFLIQRTFSGLNIPDEILETESIFLLTDFLLNQNALFDAPKTFIVKKAIKIFQDQKELTLDEIAKEAFLSRERVRQVREKCLNELFNKLLFIQNFNDDLLQKYNIDIYSNQIKIDSNIVEIINNDNRTNFSRQYITYIIFAYLFDSFSLIGEIEDVLLPKYPKSRKRNTSNRHIWSNFYLIKKEIVTEIDFIALASDIDTRINDRIEETYSFNFKSYLARFLNKNNIEVLDLIFPIAEKIVNEEFELYLDLDENIIFKRSTKKQVHEYAFEALEELGTPTKINLILDKVLELYPNYNTDEASLRAAMTRRNDFVPIGRKSVFGLKKWEIELDNFKGGTIKDVIIEFLQDQNEPAHILSVLEYLNKFRKNKDAKSVLSNLKLDPMKRFLIYNQGFIGLQIKENQYNDKFKRLPVQLGKTIIAKHKKGYSINNIKSFLRNSYDLTFEESKLILNNLKYFNENKRD